jgi:hypothetical protein
VNLESALRQLDYLDIRQVLSADAVRIDQSNLQEWNHPVTLTRDIYQNWEKALIWLGEILVPSQWTSSEVALAEHNSVPIPRTLKWDQGMATMFDETLKINNNLHDLSHIFYYQIVLSAPFACSKQTLS